MSYCIIPYIIYDILYYIIIYNVILYIIIIYIYTYVGMYTYVYMYVCTSSSPSSCAIFIPFYMVFGALFEGPIERFMRLHIVKVLYSFLLLVLLYICSVAKFIPSTKMKTCHKIIKNQSLIDKNESPGIVFSSYIPYPMPKVSICVQKHRFVIEFCMCIIIIIILKSYRAHILSQYKEKHGQFEYAIHSVCLWPYKAVLIDITFYIFCIK